MDDDREGSIDTIVAVLVCTAIWTAVIYVVAVSVG